MLSGNQYLEVYKAKHTHIVAFVREEDTIETNRRQIAELEGNVT